ncbi:TIGR03088 family PEP-CTERM/XrtA system glycosyltransferase [Denitromonas halophila]|uniref:TIGR03088 family PEP-CTERM/XrtA system glycosyltransferase n=1 Tax=Denitromonas halophila TaxID=1629404 RepID=A0A557QD91_9RHOO|nr:TIGR03088 family PEP-CTERM/XrtA system glycosyltransferase [Denitromonas halophila]TVO50875.1 TIGR03088 family PEP-CTERM/XrtA system glycosyltransferase [Denitromonas halophila]
MTEVAAPPLVAHVLYSFRIGGLENGVVNLINRMPIGRYRHVVIALSDCDSDFIKRVTRPDVEFISLHKPPGHGFKLFGAMYRLLRKLNPAIVHTRNLAALEMTLPAWIARVPVRIHGEHGWDTSDPGGASRKYRLLRRLHSPFVTQYIALSAQLSSYLTQGVGIAAARVTRICNGVDVMRFLVRAERTELPDAPSEFLSGGGLFFGTVGRLQAVKDQLNLVRAFAAWRAAGSAEALAARLVLVGDGPLRAEVEAQIAAAGLKDVVWLAGARDDVPAIMAALDCFVLPSQAEGISNTLLEAMACGLPVIATRVGGNEELVVDGETGWLVPPGDPSALAEAMSSMAKDPARRQQMSHAARARAVTQFSLEAMVDRYLALYDQTLARTVVVGSEMNSRT